MIKIENVDVFGFEASIRGMRSPMNSWDKSDSFFGCGESYRYPYCGESCCNHCYWVIGKNDLKLMKNLSKAGDDHAKFLRMINVTVDITAPLYWWKEADTYSVGVVKNSCSTMHKIHAKEFTIDDFSHEHLDNDWNDERNIVDYNGEYGNTPQDVLEWIIEALNKYRTLYIETKDKKYWWQMIQLLPSSYNQKRTVQINYQVLKHMYFARRQHKLDEWRSFCRWCETLPYFREVVIQE